MLVYYCYQLIEVGKYGAFIKNVLIILIESTEIRMYLPFSNLFGTERNSEEKIGFNEY